MNGLREVATVAESITRKRLPRKIRRFVIHRNLRVYYNLGLRKISIRAII